MLENYGIRKCRFTDAVRLYDSYLFILSSKKPQLLRLNKKPSLPQVRSRTSRSIVSLSKRRKWLQTLFG